MKVLVAYASKYGSTKGIAEFIADRLRQSGLQADLQDVAIARDAGVYDAYVVGGAAYLGSWMKEAKEFVKRNSGVLSSHPLWLFSSGPVGTQQIDAKGRDVRKTSRPKEFDELVPLVKPRDEHIFFGALFGDKLTGSVGFAYRMARRIPAAREAMPDGDFRDWREIGEWADGITSALGVTVTLRR